MARFTGNCWKCGEPWSGDSQPGRSDTCAKCDYDLHSCKNCRHHDPRYHNQCRIPETEVVRDRERSNFCELFEIGMGKEDPSRAANQESARKKLDRLFGGE